LHAGGPVMAILVRCVCGKEYHVADHKAGQRMRCYLCNESLLIAASDATEPMQQALAAQPATSAAPVAPAARRPSLAETVQEIAAELETNETNALVPWPRQCYVCGQPDECETYHFWSAFCIARPKRVRFLKNTVAVTSLYRDLKRQQVSLCRSCVVSAWRKKQVRESLLYVAGLAICLAAVAVLLVAEFFEANLQQPLTIVAAVVAGVFLVPFGMCAWRVDTATHKHDSGGTLPLRPSRHDRA